MPALRLAELAEGAGGTILRGDPATVVSRFAIDTRRMEPGGVFFALAGRQSDGHAFLPHAVEAGAAAAVIERDPAEGQPAPPALVRVEDTTAALGRCGTWVRRRYPRVRWIALTGSNGKTTTKEMIAEALSVQGRVHRTPGNFNNHLGVPLALLAMPDDADLAVLELAMSGPGEIAALTSMVDPDIGLVTNVRAVHMASFGSLDDVAAAKGELFAVLRDEATAVVNIDDGQVRLQSARHVGPQVTFGQNPKADVLLEGIENRFVPGTALTVRYRDESLRLQLRIGGAHAAYNALAALAVAAAAGAPLRPAAERIAQLEAGSGRGRVHRLNRDVLLVDDTYNSSPPALAYVLDTLRVSEPPGRRVLAMGDMLELGPMEAALHREAGRRAAAAGVQLLCAVGSLSREAVDSATQGGVREVHHYADSRACADAIAGLVRDGDLVVVKGSRAMRMGRVVRALLEALGEVR